MDEPRSARCARRATSSARATGTPTRLRRGGVRTARCAKAPSACSRCTKASPSPRRRNTTSAPSLPSSEKLRKQVCKKAAQCAAGCRQLQLSTVVDPEPEPLHLFAAKAVFVAKVADGACAACLGKKRAHTCGTHRLWRGRHFPARPSFPYFFLFSCRDALSMYYVRIE